jgi:hypothetical protein
MPKARSYSGASAARGLRADGIRPLSPASPDRGAPALVAGSYVSDPHRWQTPHFGVGETLELLASFSTYKTWVLRRFHFEFSFTPAEFSFTN